MCALQDCGSTPLLNSRSSAEATPSHFLTEPSSNNPDLITGFSDNCYDTPPAERENEADKKLSSEMLNTADFINIPSGFEEKQHFKSKNIFHIPDDYCSYEPAPAEVDHLLPSKTDKIHFVREAENLIDHGGKRAFTQRSISDYYLSKRYEEAKLTLPCTDANQTKPNISSVVSPTAESYSGYATKGESSEFCTPSNSNCFIPPSGLLFEESGTVSTERRLSVQNECMPGTSGLGQTTPEDGSASEKNLYKACNLNPTVNMKIFDTESLSESGDLATNGSSMAVDSCNQRVLDDAWFIPSSRHTFSGAELSGSASAAQLSIASSFGDSSTPTCKICHMPAKAEDPLISPCRCTGTLHYIHCGCLMRWLEICNKRSRKPPACELCKYQFHWHKKFKVRHWQFPHCSWRDKILHTVFLISVLVMIGCAIVTVMCFRQHRGNKADITHLELSQSEIITLICGALFFLAFFLAMYVEIKARNTIYKLLVKFIYLNQQWYIDEYDKKGENTVIDV